MEAFPTTSQKNTGQTQHTTETSPTLLPTPTQVDWKEEAEQQTDGDRNLKVY